MDVGVLVIRLVVGLLFMAHGAQKLLGWFGGRGVGGTAGLLGGVFGYPRPKFAAVVASLAMFGGGLSLTLGLLTPLGAAAICGIMTNVAMVLRDKGLWIANGGYEYGLTGAGVAVGLAFTGGGAYSVDGLLGWPTPDLPWALTAAALGVVSGLAVAATRRTGPPAEAGSAT